MSNLKHKNQQIFSNRDFQELIVRSANEAKQSLTVFSAYIKLNAIEWLAEHVGNIPKIKIIARWSPQDLAFKASDIEVYSFCVQQGWEFGIDNALHSKAFIFDSQTVLLGSANLTDRGLSLSRDGNLEMGTVITPTIADLNRLKLLQQNVTWLDDSIFQSIAAELEALEVEKPKTPSWSSGLIEKLNPKVEYLWISELLHSPPQAFQWLNLDDPDQLHDYELLGLNIDSFGDQDTVKNAFLTSRLYRWFKSQLRSEKDNQYTNFGWLSATLHNALLDKPPPKRSGVKEYVADFVAWLEFYAVDEIEITQHDRTKSFLLKGEN